MAPERAVGRSGESTFSNDWRKRGLGCAERMVLLIGLAPKPISQPLSVQTNDTLILIWLRRM